MHFYETLIYNSIKVLLLLLLKENPLLLKNEVVSKAVVGIAQQAVEKIDNTRSHAGKVFATLLHRFA